jgi:predicted nucleic acid-binding protein
MSILADTNILLRRTQPDHPSHTVAVESVAKLLAAGEPVYFTLQNISEFWNVATRPAPNNGLGFSVALVMAEIEKIERFLTLLPDSPAVYGEWKRLVVQHGVLGSKVHDAKLVATMNIHGVRRILTVNTGDFLDGAAGPVAPTL